MAQQSFDNRFREALWETHGKKCFHCSRELLLFDMRVDHIVPEHFHYGDLQERLKVLREIGLPEDFNILGHENLAPACERCNNRKSGDMLIGRSIAIELTRLKRSLPTLEANFNKARSTRSLEDLLRAVVRSADKGVFTLKDFQSELDKVVANAAQTDFTDKLSFEIGKIYNQSRTLGFTLHAREAMEKRNFRPDDVATALMKVMNEGTLDAKNIGGNKYVVRGRNDLRVAFSVFGETIVVTTVYMK